MKEKRKRERRTTGCVIWRHGASCTPGHDWRWREQRRQTQSDQNGQKLYRRWSPKTPTIEPIHSVEETRRMNSPMLKRSTGRSRIMHKLPA
ncbi:hypothetical protein AURDEDRAFT_114499 [Auricularia subglabra TFB-10046 SS5]|nr:hypothetical protein AURDEDRAFT_114499 [Auricularia subglabra TFB-10046 SS5]